MTGSYDLKETPEQQLVGAVPKDQQQEEEEHHHQIVGANFPMTEEGRTYHVGVKAGEVANRIVCVGDLNRAQMYADLFLDRDEGAPPVFRYLSSRGFLTLTGRYRGVPVSIIGTGMGCAMMDFTIREVRAVLRGDMCMVRTGTCGTPDPTIRPGDVVVNESAVLVQRNPDAFRVKQHLAAAADNSSTTPPPPYKVSLPVYADPTLTSILRECMEKEVCGNNNNSNDGDNDGGRVHVGMNATGDSFYASQGRIGTHFDDRNEHLLDLLRSERPEVNSIEMETFHLFDMADCARGERMHAGSALIVLAQRNADTFIDLDLKHKRERQAGRAALEAVIQFPLQSTHPEEDGAVWTVTGGSHRQ